MKDTNKVNFVRPTGYDAPITPIEHDFVMMEIGYKKACRHMIDRLLSMDVDDKYKWDRMHVADEYGGSPWYVRLLSVVGIAEDLLEEAAHLAREDESPQEENDDEEVRQ